MNPYKILSITEQATDEEVKRAYRAMAAKYHPDVGGDAWAFEQVRDAYDRIQKLRRGADQAASRAAQPRNQNATQPPPHAASQKTSQSASPQSSTSNAGSQTPFTSQTTDQRPASAAEALGATEQSQKDGAAATSLVQRVVNAMFRHQLPLQSETSFFILANVLDIVFTNILLRMHAIEANPIANYFLIYWGFHGMIAFKLFLVTFVCLITQLIAVQHLVRARQTLYLGTLIVTVVVIYSGLLLMRT